MCLMIKRYGRKKIAQSSIDIYKILRCILWSTEEFKSLWHNHLWELNTIYTIPSIKNNEDIVKSPFSNIRVIKQNYFHSFLTFKAAQEYLLYYNLMYLPKVIMTRGIIPKGTLYWIGKNNDIASKRLKIVSIVN